MKLHIAIPLVVALAATVFHVAQAQTGTTSPSREAVRAEAISAAASKPKGEMSTPNQDKALRAGPATAASGAQSRAEVKADTVAAEKQRKGGLSRGNRNEGVRAASNGASGASGAMSGQPRP